MSRINYRFMKKGEKDKLPEGYKKHPLIREFPGVWTRFKNWTNFPPMVAVEGNKIVGFHVATFNKKVYINSYYLYVADEYRGRGIAGGLFEFAIREAQKRSLTRYKNACKTGADGDLFYKGFGLKPVAFSEDHVFYDFSIEGLEELSDLRLIQENDVVPAKSLQFHLKKKRKIAKFISHVRQLELEI